MHDKKNKGDQSDMQHILNAEIGREKSGTSMWKQFAVFIGFMKNPQEPSYNGATIILTIAVIGLLTFILLQGAVGKLDNLDAERGKQAILYSTANRINQRATNSDQKRAELLEIMKKKGIYEEVPEHLKIFEDSGLYELNLQQSKPEK